MNVTRFMKRNVISVNERSSVKEAALLFVKHHIGMLPVVDHENKLVGILKMTDLISIAMPDFVDLVNDFTFIHDFGAMEGHLPTPFELNGSVQDVMQKPVFIKDSASLFYAAAILIQNKSYDLPIVDEENRLVGLVSHVDIGTALMEKWFPSTNA